MSAKVHESPLSCQLNTGAQAVNAWLHVGCSKALLTACAMSTQLSLTTSQEKVAGLIVLQPFSGIPLLQYMNLTM